MRINDTSNKHISLYHDFLFWTKAEDDSDTLADFIRNANFALDNVVRKIYQVDAKWQYDDRNNVDYPIATADLVSGQTNYSLADSHLRISRVRIKNSKGTWVTLNPVDRNDLSDTDLNSTGTPTQYDKLGGGVFIRPTPDYSQQDGIEITFQRGSNYFAENDTTKEPGFDSLFHRYISLLPAKDFTATNDMAGQYRTILNELEVLDQEVIQLYGTRDRDGTFKASLKRTKRHY
jgi:hypothetical protein